MLTSQSFISQPTQPTQSTQSTTPFIRVPNHIIHLSNTQNSLILPLYLYSAVNLNPYNNDTIDTNIALIQSTFNLTSSQVSLLRSAFNTLSTDSEYSSASFSPIISPSSSFPSYKSKTEHIQYTFLDRRCSFDSHWTKLTYKEYYYIISLSSSTFTHPSPTHKSLRYNISELFNLYLLMKFNISLSYFATKTSVSPYKFYTGIAYTKLLNSVSFSKNTLTKYLNQLESLGLLSIMRESQFPQSSRSSSLSQSFTKSISYKIVNKYALSSKWLHLFNQ